jgi:hypothetical protein
LDRCALFVDAGYALADGAMAVHGTRRRDSVSWDHAGLIKLLNGLARDRTGLPVLRCYWYEATAEGSRTAEHDALADMPGLKLRLVNVRPGRREGIETQLRRDLVTLAKNGAISDAFVASANENLAEIVAEVQDLGLRVVILHIASDGGWTVPQSLRQESDDLVEISGVHLRPFVDLIRGAEPANSDELYAGPTFGSRSLAGAGAPMSGAMTHQGRPAAALPAPGAVYAMPAGPDYRQGAQPYADAGAAQPNVQAGYQGGNADLQSAGQPAQSAQQQTGAAQSGSMPGRPAQNGYQGSAQDSAAQNGAQQQGGYPGSTGQAGLPADSYQSGLGQSGLGQSGLGQSGAVPSGAVPSSAMPNSAVPSGAVPSGAVPNSAAYGGQVHSQAPSAGPVPPSSAPAGQAPAGTAPAGPALGVQGPGTPGGHALGNGMQAQNTPAQGGPVLGGPVQRPGQGGPVQGPAQGGPGQGSTPGQPGMAQGGYQNGSVQNGSMQGGYQNGAGQSQGGAGPNGTPQNGYPAGGAQQASYHNGWPQIGPQQGGYQHGSAPSGALPGDMYGGTYGAGPPAAAQSGFDAAPTSGQHQQVYGSPDPGYFPDQPAVVSQDQGQRAQYPPQQSAPQAGSAFPAQGQYAVPQPAAQLPAVRAMQSVAVSLPDAVKAAHAEGYGFGESVGRDAPALWLDAVLARKPRMPSDLEARLLQGSALPIDSLLHDEVRHSLRRGFWDALESARR